MIWVNIGRGATLRLVCRRLYPQAADSRHSECDEIYLRSQKLAERCTESAVIVISWIGQLRSRNLLATFSFTDIHTCSSAVIVLLLNVLLRPYYQHSLAISCGIEALGFMANGSTLAMHALRLVERLQEGVYKATGMAGRDDNLDQQLSSMATSGQKSSPSDTLNYATDLPHVDVDTSYYNTAPDIAPLDLNLFADLEPSLLEYSEQYLTLFGFDGFGSTFDPNFSM